MAVYENKIVLRGYLRRNAECLATKKQQHFTILLLATKSGFRDKRNGEWVTRTHWHRILVFGHAGESAKSLRKGDYVEIEGTLDSILFRRRDQGSNQKAEFQPNACQIRASVFRKLVPPRRIREPIQDPETFNSGDAA